MSFLRQSAAAYIDLGPFLDDTDGKTAETGLTIAAADVLLSKNGGTMAAKSHASACSHLSAGNYRCPLATADVATCGRLTVRVHKSGALPVWEKLTVLPGQVYDSLVGGTDLVQVDVQQVLGVQQTADLDGIKSDTSAIAAKLPSKAYLTGTANSDGDIEADGMTGNFAGSVASVGNLSATAIVDAVWDETIADHAGVGSTGAALAAAGGSGDPWSTSLPGAYGAGTAGKILAEVLSDTSAIAAAATEARLAELDAGNLPTDVAAVASALSTVDGIVDAILADTSAICVKLPTKAYLTGTANSDGDIQADSATGNFPGSVASVVGAVGSVTGNVGGNVAGTVASVVTKTGYALTADYDPAKMAAQSSSLSAISVTLASVKSDTSAVAAVDFGALTSAILALDVSALASLDLSAVAALGVVCTEERLAQLDAGNLPADVTAIAGDVTAILADTSAIAALPSAATIKTALEVTGGYLERLHRAYYGKAAMTATDLKIYADDGTTVVTRQVLSDDGTTQTRGAAT